MENSKLLKKWSRTKVKSAAKSSPPLTLEGWSSASAKIQLLDCFILFKEFLKGRY